MADTTEKQGNPRYTGMFMYIDPDKAFAIWLPTGWTKYEMKKGHHGVIFSPYPDHYDTSFTAEFHRLKFSVTNDDLPLLQESFEEGINALPGVEVEEFIYTPTTAIIALEAKFTFLEGENRRKRWVRNLYWGNGQLVFIAQGATPKEYDYWLPMFYNTMVTFQVM
jgi:hypothetical protein